MSTAVGVSKGGVDGTAAEEVRRSVRIKTKKPKPKKTHSSPWPIDIHALCGKRAKKKPGMLTQKGEVEQAFKSQLILPQEK